jgi:hypothetical protein
MIRIQKTVKRRNRLKKTSFRCHWRKKSFFVFELHVRKVPSAVEARGTHPSGPARETVASSVWTYAWRMIPVDVAVEIADSS